MTHRQMAFDLGASETYGREDFFPAASNAAAWHAIETAEQWPQSRLLLIGPEGAGKTHLAHIWAQTNGAKILPAASLATVDPTTLQSPLAVEDADETAGLPAPEEALFHLINHCQHSKTRLLITAKSPPRDWGIALPDLLSRLQSMGLAQLHAPDDALLSAVLVKLFADRQITVPPNLIPYLSARMERSIAAARALVARLDAHALQLGRPVTRALAADLLDSPGQG